jgi:hypothetical protein
MGVLNPKPYSLQLILTPLKEELEREQSMRRVHSAAAFERQLGEACNAKVNPKP